MNDPLTMRVGPQTNADGTTPVARGAKTGEQCVVQAHGKYYEAAHRGVLFAACDQGTGMAPGTALGTSAVLCLYNPANSGRRLAIKKVRAGYVSGTLGAGTLYHCVNNSTTQTAPSSGNLQTPVCSDVGNGASPVGVVRTGATTAQPVAYAPFASLTALLASTAVGPYQLEEDLDGEIVLEPGTTYQLQAVAAGGTSPKITAGITWEEVPIV